MGAIFITATGTDIGKTFVTAGLIRHFRRAGRLVDTYKPVATGFDPARLGASDAGVLLDALGRPITPEAIASMSPWRFRAPLAPDLAARRENRSIDFGALVEFSRKAARETARTTLIEGIGGIMVPLTDRHTVLDWMTALAVPIVLVAGSYLGSISHTLTCLDVLRRRALPVCAVIVNETQDSTVALADTIENVTRFAGEIPVLGLRRDAAVERDFGEIALLLP